jgi:hypothetical protein
LPLTLIQVNARCVDINGATSAAIIRKYCMCMNEKMGDNENLLHLAVGQGKSQGAHGLRQGIGLEIS